MSTTVHYEDRTLKTASRFFWAATLLGLTSVAFALAGIGDFSVTTPLVLTVFCAFVAFFYRSAVAVEVEVGPEGISKQQGLGLGWRLDWASVAELVVVPLDHPRLAVVSAELSDRRGLSEWPLRKSRLPRTSRSMPATSDIMDAVSTHSGRPIHALPEF